MNAAAWWRTILMTLTLLAAVHGKSLFRAPTDAATPFRRDGLPLDVDTINGLANSLTDLGLAAGRSPEAPLRRAGAQLFALAAALDPANRRAGDAAKRLEAGDFPELPTADQLAAARARAWGIWSWLASPEAGPDGQAFAACLGDAMATVDPHHPKAEPLHGAGEKGHWSTWVGELADYQEPKTRKPDDADSGTAKNGGKTDGGKTGDHSPPNGPAQIRLKSAEVTMYLSYVDASTKTTLSGVVPVHMTASTQEPVSNSGSGGSGSTPPAHHNFSLQVTGVGEAWHVAKSQAAVLAALQKTHGNLPTNANVQLEFGKKIDYSVPLNDDAYSGPAAVLANAALTGKPPVEDLIVFGAIRGDGDFGTLKRPWEPLLSLAQGNSGRLIVPKEALDLLTGLLVLEKPEFFLQHEVFAAANFPQLVEQATPPEQGPLAEAIDKFAEIRRVGEGKPVGQFLAHPATRQRLSEILQLYPDHLSARMLLLQGSGRRPVKFSTANLAREIRRALKPMVWIPTADARGILAAKVESAHTDCRRNLDHLASCVDLQDRQLHEQALALANNLRTMARTIHHSGPPTSTYSQWGPRDKDVAPQIRQIANEHRAYMKRLDDLSADDGAPSVKTTPVSTTPAK